MEEKKKKKLCPEARRLQISPCASVPCDTFGAKSFCQLDNLPTWHLVNFLFIQLAIFVNVYVANAMFSLLKLPNCELLFIMP